MNTKKPRSIFLNLHVRELAKTKEFFSKLGFEFNPQFTDNNAACMIISETAFVMLLEKPFFQNFTKRELSDPSKVTEGLYALSCESRAEVDEMVKKAIAAGGKPAMEPQDHGFMYGHSFYDVDDHHWEVVWMDPAHVQK